LAFLNIRILDEMKNLFIKAIFLSSIAIVPSVEAASARIERVEPPSWWVGMKSANLTLMVHGEAISEFTPALLKSNVRLNGITRTDNPNYLFIDLAIPANTPAGKFDIVFKRGAERMVYKYELLPREQNSANRVGFSTADLIVNLMPDRFANGNPANDNVEGYSDVADRQNIDAGRHGGDIRGIVDSLGYLASMGYTILWPTPLTESNQPNYSYHGYAATDTYKIDPRYGSNDEYRRMVSAARDVGIGVVQDIVLNHIGSNHWWMRDLPTKDWLSFRGEYVPTNHARTTVNDPYASASDKKKFTAGWFERDMPDINQQNKLVSTYQIQNTIWWIEYAGLAGIRADTYGYSDPAFLTEWSRRVMDEYPNLNIVGEEWSHNPATVSYWQRGKKNANGYVSHLPSMMDFPLNEILRQSLVLDESPDSGLTDLYKGLANDILYPDPMNLVLFEGNHDLPRIFSVLNEDFDLYKMAMAYMLTMRGIPQIYYGSEVLMTSPKTREDGKFRRDFPGGWPGDRVNALTGEGLTAQQREAQFYVKRLANWRKTQSAIHKGRLMHFVPENGTYVYFRYDDASKVMVVLNKGKSEQVLQTRRFEEILPAGASGVDVITGQKFDLRQTLKIAARSALILELK
jgi:neopullulanase